MNDCPEWSAFEPLPPCQVSMRLHVDDERLTNRPYAVVLCHVSKERVTIRQLREQRLAQILDWVPGHLATETEMLPLLQLQIAKGGYVIASFAYLAEALKFLWPQGWGR